MNPEPLSNPKDGGFFYAVEAAQFTHGSVVLAGDGRKGVSGADSVVAHCGGLGGGACGSLLLGLFLRCYAVLFIRSENLVFVVYALDIPLVGVEIPGTDLEKPVPERAGFKINEPP